MSSEYPIHLDWAISVNKRHPYCLFALIFRIVAIYECFTWSNSPSEPKTTNLRQLSIGIYFTYGSYIRPYFWAILSPNDLDIASPGPHWSCPFPHNLKGLVGICYFPNVFLITPPKNYILFASYGFEGLCYEDIV